MMSSRGTSYTFAQIAEFVRQVEPSQTPGTINYCGMIAELAEAMDRFEHNTAQALARISPHWRPQTSVEVWLAELRQEVPAAGEEQQS